MERVSTAGLGQALLRSAMNVQAKLAEKQTANSSGLKAETYAGLGAGAARLVSMETSLAQLQARSDTAQTALDRTEAMYAAVDSMVDLTTSMRTTLSGLSTNSSSEVDYNQIGKNMLTDLENLMNLQVDGRYLFSGSATTSVPVDTTLLTAPTTPSVADTSYYLGDDVVQSVKVSDQTGIDYGVTASESGFEKALRAANILANLDTSDLDEDAVSEAYDLATAALDELLASQGRLSVNAGRLENYQAQQDTSISLLSDRISDAKAVDVAQTTVEISQYQTTLQASYAALGKLNGLSLVDYL
ncbi:flagellin [Magnetospirillum sulfuroxidans]|uniref:Flagellin n=1 Tax=Magnetospirillum sulfuroxidans TaxID=611300 RepID=A0ABS5IAL3_9PROT|nr:flagellin [Magnetospirillum sulfuroxidans]MBR9971469.1 flagellin [Magnetospirillum sulfuroxidans]